MHPEVTWTHACLERLETAARATRWHLDQVGEQRADIAPIWNDACAREFGQRYLTPLTEDASGALTGITQASHDLRSCIDAVQRAEKFCTTAANLSRRVQAAIPEAQSLLRAAGQQADQALVHVDAAQQQISRARALLAEADAAGG